MAARERYGATRRGFLLATGSLAAMLGASREGAGQELVPTPACDDHGSATPQQGEGPFFKPRSPERADFREQGASGRQVELSGLVLTRRCKPLAGAVLDLWHADDKGAYDNTGFRYRGHQFTDAEGRYRLETILPAVYPGRTRHIHVKVQPPGGRLVTTQLYFPGEAANRRDGLFREELTLKGNGTFDFVVL